MSSALTGDEKIVVDRNYTDNFSIKDTAITNLAQKYFPDINLSALNVGELGFVLEQIANITEDSFNTASVLINEAFPNKAVIPESIYSHAAIFQLNDTFVSCGSCSFILLLQQSDVLTYGEDVNNKKYMYIDKNTIITVSDESNNLSIPFTLDYDIQITARKKNTDSGFIYDYSAQYVPDSSNSISDIHDPYLKIRAMNGGYIILQFTAHQVERSEVVIPVVNNSKINYPILTFDFNDNLAGMDIFYRSPSSTEFIQLEKRVKFSLPIKTPFCYYRLKDTYTVELSFTSRDGYFQPEFNSEIKVVMYTTMGKKAEFSSYNGTSIDFQMNSDKYQYNNSLIISAKVVSACTGGSERMSIDELKALTVESYSSAGELSDENDIMTYFYNYKYRYGNEILVAKRRDDISERLFSAFLLLKNESYIYPTNTTNLSIVEDDFDIVDNDTYRYTLNPGHVFVYDESDSDLVVMAKDENGNPIMAYDVDAVTDLMSPTIDENGNEKYKFVYTNPFLISVNKSPNIVGLYKTVISNDIQLDYTYSDSDVFTQFISNRIHISRTLSDQSEYLLSLSLIPSASLSDDDIESKYITNLNTYDGNYVRVIIGFVGSGVDERGYVELYPTEQNSLDIVNVTFSAKIRTNDGINSNGEFALISDNIIKSFNHSKSDYVYIPIADSVLNVYILYKTDNGGDNMFTKYPEYMETGISDFSVVNTYSTKSEKVTFIEPMNMMRSIVTFHKNVNTSKTATTQMKLSLLPMVKADMVHDDATFGLFVNTLTKNYRYIEECLPRLRNNTHIDVKFYNTYGRSKNYFVGDEDEQMDRVNIVIKFKVSLIDGADDNDVKIRLKDFIKKSIEQINSSGNNSLYVSNLIKEIELNFGEIHHLKFEGINGYNTDYQVIRVNTTDIKTLSKDEQRKYVPEILIADVEVSIDVDKHL